MCKTDTSVRGIYRIEYISASCYNFIKITSQSKRAHKHPAYIFCEFGIIQEE